MTYTINYTFGSTLAEDTPVGTPLTKNEPYAIQVTATIVDDTGATVTDQKIQFNTYPLTLIVLADDGTAIDLDPVYGSYIIDPDLEGNFTFWLVASQKTIVTTGFIVQDDAESVQDGPVVFFSSYRGLVTKYGAPILPIDEKGIIQIERHEQYITVVLPISTSPYKEYDTATVALLINGSQFVQGNFIEIYNNGFKVPTNMLNTDQLNRFGYTIVNASTAISPVAPQAPVNGEINNRPIDSILRTLVESPHLPQFAQVINDPSNDAMVIIDTTNNPDKLGAGDVIKITVYINAWRQGTNIPNNTIISLHEITIQTINIGEPIVAIIPKAKLAGYGMDASGNAGTLYIDYTLTKNGENTVSALPMRYFTGYINTVGPI